MSKKPSQPVLEVSCLTAAYGRDVALENISFNAGKGEILGVVGPNGAGKSTLIKVLSGVLGIKSGLVRINGQEINSYKPAQRARTLSVVPQARQFGGTFSVRQAVMLGRTAYLGFLGNPGEEDLRQVDWAMDQTG